MKEFPNKNWSGGFLYNSKTKSVLLNKRDGNTKFNPNKWAFFGGLAEGNETPEQCLVRELKEELNFDVTPDELIQVCDYLNKELNTYRYVFCIPSEIEKTKLVLGEGAGFDWIPLDKLYDYELTEKTIKDLNTFIEKLI